MTENLLRPSFLAEAVLEIARQTGHTAEQVVEALADHRLLYREDCVDILGVIERRFEVPDEEKEQEGE